MSGNGPFVSSTNNNAKKRKKKTHCQTSAEESFLLPYLNTVLSVTSGMYQQKSSIKILTTRETPSNSHFNNSPAYNIDQIPPYNLSNTVNKH